jgi:hypothetical protein
MQEPKSLMKRRDLYILLITFSVMGAVVISLLPRPAWSYIF